MDYVTRYTDLIYFASGEIASCRYRFIKSRDNQKQVIVQITHRNDQTANLTADHQTRDAILNRIADRELAGIPFSMLCVALTEGDTHHIVFPEPDLEDYIQRGHPYQQTPERAARGRHIERISIDSRNLVIGRARIQTAHATPTPPDTHLAAVLNRPEAA
ncbi:hypothetical protein WS87_00010 (plasmid) [Burkholderia sp. MSMB0856]|uniref:hypothetical protein n=1 Tax=Burkholderia sp. MSMB0856 TaxID=1637869 RepID=UPI000858EC37|nr:hypothetical protein [Burkholderia sp. MSMB0856]AOJ85187.1 hypothetical protein WS87_00010 [Burkholderia sp. MSMB0856]